MLAGYFKSLYQRSMNEAYRVATAEIVQSIRGGSSVLDCGAGRGRMFDVLSKAAPLSAAQYHGVDWSPDNAAVGRQRGLQIVCADLNTGIPFDSGRFSCVFALSLLEHLLNGCHYMQECHRVLDQDGRLVLLTPNISTYFTAALILLGRMPSSGPHPDSDALQKAEELFKVSRDGLQPDSEGDRPMHRHLVVFSFRVLRDYLNMIGFVDVRGRGFGLYPFPAFAQPFLERIDPWHCHQMVFTARKAAHADAERANP